MEQSLYLMKYEIFLAEQMIEQEQINALVQECLLTESGTLTSRKMNIINEGAFDKIKSAISKILEAIAKMWNKFLESTKKFLSSDKSYLEKYKDIITKKKLIDASYTTYKYDLGIPILLSTTVPAFNYQVMKNELGSDADFIKHHFSKFANDKIEFVDNVRAIFRNGPNGGSDRVSRNSNEFNMTDIYNYCYNYKTLVQKIENDIDAVKKAGFDAIKIVDQESKKQPQQQPSGQTQQSDGTQQSTQQQNNQQSDGTQNAQPKQENSIYYSNMYKTYVNEIERELPNQQGASNNSNTSNPSKNVQNISGNSTNADQTRADINGIDPKVVGEHINRYMRICGDILGAKLTISQEIYKEYMSLIRYHVRDHVGTKDADKQDKPVERGTNYSGENQNSNQNNSQNNSQDNTQNPPPNQNGIINKIKSVFGSSKNL